MNDIRASRNNAAIAAQASSRAERVNAAFHTVLTVHGATPAQRAVVMALADIGVMPTPSPQLSMNAKASTAGGTPSAAGSGTAAPSSAMTATGLRPICPHAISTTGASSGSANGGSQASNGANPAAGSTPASAKAMKPEAASTVAS